MKIKDILLICILFSSLSASTGSLGENLSLFSIIPFIGILLSIAIAPLLAPIFWHHNFGKISAFWSILFIIPFIYNFGAHVCLHQIFHVLLLEYLPFIILLLSLFTISGGIKFEGTILGTPRLNTILLFIGTILASWMGTTGAAMLLIRPLIIANNYRKYKVHTIIFFIFLVANIGGSLTPLGDPPLFLGFLSGIDFFWTTKAMFFPMIITALILLLVYFVLDTYYYRKKEYQIVTKLATEKKIAIRGSFNIILVVGVVFSVLISGFWKPNIPIPDVFGVHLELQNITRDIILLVLTYISWTFTPKIIREDNAFSWFPILDYAITHIVVLCS